MTAQAEDRKTPIVRNSWIATGVWLFLCALLFVLGAPCAEQGNFVETRVSCLTVNEMGDALAGAFAPLAFLWLIAAVLLQRSELAEQRRELRESREIAKQQVEESRRNVDFIGEQTELQKQLRKMQVEQNNDAEVETLIEVANVTFDRMKERTQVSHLGTEIAWLSFSWPEQASRRLAARLSSLIELAQTVRSRHGDNGPVEFENGEMFQLLYDDLTALHHTAQKASSSTRAGVLQMQVREGRMACQTIMTYVTDDFGGDAGDI